MDQKQPCVKIYTMTHRTFTCPEEKIYIPLHVGRKNAQDLGYLGDDTGDNISDQNPYYGELTGLYWVWKNETEADIIGICHYRRYFLTDEQTLMTEEDYKRYLSDCDILISEMSAENGATNWEYYTIAHNVADVKAVGEAIRQCYPEDYAAFCKVMGEQTSCFGNLMVTSRKYFCEYCEWLFTIFDVASKQIDASGYDAYHKRVYGFLSEILLYVWVVARNLRWKECQIGLTQEKAETTELKQKVGTLIAQGEIEAAKRFFYEYTKQRPDVRLPLSDLAGELDVLEKLLYILHEEQKRGEEGFLSLAGDLQVLFMHYGNVRKLMGQYGRHVREAAVDYFSEFPVSDCALELIWQDLRGELSFFDYLQEDSAPVKVSVVLAVCAEDEGLLETLGNLVHQTLQELELILVDNKAAGEYHAMMEDCQRQYPDRVRVLKLSERCSEREAQEKGSALARGQYIALVRTGDIPDVTLYEKLYARAAAGDAAGCRVIDAKGEELTDSCGEDMSGRIVRRECWEKNQWSGMDVENRVEEILYRRH